MCHALLDIIKHTSTGGAILESYIYLKIGNYHLTVALYSLHHTGLRVFLSNSQKKATEHTSQNTELQLINELFWHHLIENILLLFAKLPTRPTHPASIITCYCYQSFICWETVQWAYTHPLQHPINPEQ